MNLLKPIHEQVAVIMGASSGIGRACALRFAAEGARVVVAARGEKGLHSLVHEIRNHGGEATAVAADTSNFEQVQAVARAAVEHYGRLDTWIHAAAVSVYARFEDTTPEEFRHIVYVNLVGQAYGAMAALPHLRREGRGALIAISSAEAQRALPYHAAYAASKQGVKGLLETVRTELQHDGVPISVTNVMPASINTPFFDHARTRLGVKPRGIPPVYEPEVVVEAIVYAAQHPVRDIYAGGAGWGLALGQTISPKLVDAAMVRFGFKMQRTDEPKSADAPHNLFGPIDRPYQVHGDFGDEALPGSMVTRLQTMNGFLVSAGSVALGAAAAIMLRTRRKRA